MKVEKLSKLKAVSRMVWIGVLVVIILIAALGAYYWYISQPAPVEKVINIAWTEGPEFDFIQGKLPEFQTQTGITVNFLKIPRAHIIERLMLEMLRTTPTIDGSIVYVLEAPSLAATGGLVNLYNYRSKTDWVNQGFYQDQLEILEFNGSL
jgi:ABC-type glycerol-3-phosphate transport system substrate-binding protein